jgi:hypothetical protein
MEWMEARDRVDWPRIRIAEERLPPAQVECKVAGAELLLFASLLLSKGSAEADKSNRRLLISS